MVRRMIVRSSFVFAFLAALLVSPVPSAEAQSPTNDVVACIDNAANELKKCVDEVRWYAEALCYARYASDGILCAPGVALSALK